MRKFIRVKATLDAGDSKYLAPDPNVPNWWTSVEDKKKAYEFKNKREAYETLLRLDGQWLIRGRIVHVRAYPKVKQ
jgi:hypothetical protein